MTFREMKRFSIRAPLGGYWLLNPCSWRGNTAPLGVAWRAWLLARCGPAAGVDEGSNGLNSGQAAWPQVSRVSADICLSRLWRTLHFGNSRMCCVCAQVYLGLGRLTSPVSDLDARAYLV